MPLRPFHLAFPVRDLAEARAFWGGVIGCPEGRSSDAWIDFDFYGHQVVAHLSPEECRLAPTGEVDGDAVPVRHFGAILDHDSLVAEPYFPKSWLEKDPSVRYLLMQTAPLLVPYRANATFRAKVR